MKLYRYMSMKEFSKLSSGCILENKNTFMKNRTSSIGFCFLPEEIKIKDKTGEYNLTPVESLEFLEGIVTNDVLVEFIVNSDLVQKSNGVYANPFIDEWDCYVEITEYCAKQYSKETFIPIRYAIVSDSNNAVWYDFN